VWCTALRSSIRIQIPYGKGTTCPAFDALSRRQSELILVPPPMSWSNQLFSHASSIRLLSWFGMPSAKTSTTYLANRGPKSLASFHKSAFVHSLELFGVSKWWTLVAILYFPPLTWRCCDTLVGSRFDRWTLFRLREPHAIRLDLLHWRALLGLVEELVIDFLSTGRPYLYKQRPNVSPSLCRISISDVQRESFYGSPFFCWWGVEEIKGTTWLCSMFT